MNKDIGRFAWSTQWSKFPSSGRVNMVDTIEWENNIRSSAEPEKKIAQQEQNVEAPE